MDDAPGINQTHGIEKELWGRVEWGLGGRTGSTQSLPGTVPINIWDAILEFQISEELITFAKFATP
jgi:hypothetical protein